MRRDNLSWAGRAVLFSAFIASSFHSALGQLVSEGPSGLVYQLYANEGQTNAVNQVPDFSAAGYGGGGVAIPFIPAAVNISDGPGDDTVLIQSAIDQVAALPVGPDGFRGAVVLAPGEYSVSDSLTINASGIVVRGAGSSDGGGTRITFTTTVQKDLFKIEGAGGPATTGPTLTVADAYLPVGSKMLTVSDASTLAAGDLIRITNTMNQQWIDDIGMNAAGPLGVENEQWSPGGYQLRHYRYIEAINGNVLTLNAPIVQVIETQYGGGEVRKCTWNNVIENIGIEGLRLESTFANDTDPNHGWHGVTMTNVRNAWVRQITTRYFGRGLVTVRRRCEYVTIEDCAHLDPKGPIAGGNRYSFVLDESSYGLFQRCVARNGRHDFVTGSRSSGPNVFVDSFANEVLNDTGPHNNYAMGELYDNIQLEDNPNDGDDAIRVQNRTTSGSGHGWSGAQIMFWNNRAAEFVCDSPVGAMNWAVGNIGVKAESTRSPSEPFGIFESHNTHVQPRSLYYAQLRDRMGAAALQNIMLPSQQKGTIWPEIKAWEGNGILGPALALWSADGSPPEINSPSALRTIVRDLHLLDQSPTYQWTLIAGPGSVVFADATAPDTTATFASPGIYTLALTASGGGRTLQNTLRISVAGPADTLAPVPPTSLVATPLSNEVELDWAVGSDPDIASYVIYRSETSSSYGAPLASSVTASRFTDRTAINGTTYFYRVTTVDTSGNESTPSLEVSATPDSNLGTSNQSTSAFDYGTVPGKTTMSSAGFQTTTPASGTSSHVDDAWRIASGATAGHDNFAFVDTFAGIGAPMTNDFAITLEARVVTIGDGLKNNYRYGIALLNDPTDLENAGLTAILVYDNETLRMELRQGLNSTTLASKTFATIPGTARPYAYPEGLTYTFRVEGNLSAADALDLTFTLSDGTLSESISTTVDPVSYPASHFGGTARIRNGFAVDFDHLTLEIDTTPPAPTVPQALEASPGYALTALDWDDFAGAVSYDIYRRESNGSYTTPLASGLTDSSFLDLGAAYGNTYSYVVRAVRGDGSVSGQSDEITLTLDSDLDDDAMDDRWEQANFGNYRMRRGDADSDSDGVFDFFEYLFDTDPNDSASLRRSTLGRRSAQGDVFEWEVRPGLTLGTDYALEYSTNLGSWNPLPTGHFTTTQAPSGAREKVTVTITHDYGDGLFIRLRNP